MWITHSHLYAHNFPDISSVSYYLVSPKYMDVPPKINIIIKGLLSMLNMALKTEILGLK